MKIGIIKHEGKNWFGNVLGDRTMELTNGSKFWIGTYFFRRKDAKEYMKAQYPNNPYLEVISAELASSNKDNRKS